MHGQLGQGNRLTVARPLQVGVDRDWRNISIAQDHACGIRTDDSLWCWGSDAHRALGNGPRGNELVPERLPGAWAQIATGSKHTCAIATEGTLWCWGANDSRQLGLPVSIADFVDVPMQVGSDSDWIAVSTLGFAGDAQSVPGEWTAVAAGIAHSCAIDVDAQLWCAGANSHGELGDAGSLSATPALVGGEYTSVTVGFAHVCGLRGSEVSCWGRNREGQLADGGRLVVLLGPEPLLATR